MFMKRILNAGCGIDLEYGTDFIDLYPQNEKVKKCDLDKDRIPFDDNTFDEVYSKCVFEHLTNPSNFMKESHRVLKPGGKLNIITDNATYIGWWTTLHKYDSSCGKEDMHYALFTSSHMENWAKKFDFEILEIKYSPFFDPNSSFIKTLFKKILYYLLPKQIGSTRIELIAKKRDI